MSSFQLWLCEVSTCGSGKFPFVALSSFRLLLCQVSTCGSVKFPPVALSALFVSSVRVVGSEGVAVLEDVGGGSLPPCNYVTRGLWGQE